MRNLCFAGITAVLLLNLVSCSHANDPSTASAANVPDSANVPTAAAPVPVPPPAPVVTTITVPAGTKLHVALIDSLSTTKNQPGDRFTASLTQPVTVNGETVFAKGAQLYGRVEDVKESGRVKGVASIELVLTTVSREGIEIPINTQTFSAEAQSTKKKDGEVVGGGAGVGALIGAIAGGKKGAGLGALVGGGAGTADVLATRGQELNYPPETRFTFTLASSIEVRE